MSNCAIFWRLPRAAGTLVMPTTRGRFLVSNLCPVSLQLLPTDPVGIATVTFSGVIANSEIRVYGPSGELAGIEDCAANQSLSWSVYAPGNPDNDVTIRIVKLDKKIKDFPYTSAVGAQSIPIQQETDPWYRNL